MNSQKNSRAADIRKIGLTGGMASGKSQTAELLLKMIGGKHIDADQVCRQILEPHGLGWQAFTHVFGQDYLLADQSINRPQLREMIFSDAPFREQVNSIIHPIVRENIVSQMETLLKQSDCARVIVEVPLLYEVHWEDLFDLVVVVYADHETCLKRLMTRDGVDEEQARKAMECQMDLSEKALRADHVIDNSGSMLDTQRQVEQFVLFLQNNGNLRKKT